MNDLSIRDGIVINKEDVHFEAKTSLSRSVWETYSAFANTDGGVIVIGLSERQDGEGFDIVGVKDTEKVLSEIWNTLNNRQIISVNLLSDDDVRVLEVEGRQLIAMNISPAHRVMRPVYVTNIENGTYKRCGSGDYHCTTMEIASLFRDASPDSRDLLPTAFSTLDDLDETSVERYRTLLSTHNPANNSVNGTTEEFLRLINAARMTDRGLVPTFAGLLMFGKYSSIVLEVHGFSLDYREYNDMSNEWNLRLQSGALNWSGNVFEFYTFVTSRLPLMVGTGFSVPNGTVREDDTKVVRMLREIVTNAVAHADYFGHGGIVIEMHPDRLTAQNPGTFRIPIETAEEGGQSDPRNEGIFRMLNLIGWAERAGTGVRNIVNTCREQGIGGPEISEIPRPEAVRVAVCFRSFGQPYVTMADRIEEMMIEDSKITAAEIASRLGVGKGTVVGEIDRMKAEGRIERIGGPRGRWNILGRRV